MECVILAAGLSRRLGMDKALIDVGSQPLISWISRRLSSRVANITIVANESNFTEISKTVPNVNVILNRDYRLLVVPVDRPGFSDSTLERLIYSQETCCPMKEGKGGHPLVLTFEDVDKVRKSSANSPLREIINASRFEVLDRFLDLNIDTPADIINLKDKLKSINE